MITSIAHARFPVAIPGLMVAAVFALAAAWPAPAQASSRTWAPASDHWNDADRDDREDRYYRPRHRHRHWRDRPRPRVVHYHEHYHERVRYVRPRPEPRLDTGYRGPAYAPPPRFWPGRCGRKILGGVIGAAAGAVAGANIGKGDGRTAAIAGGTLLGYLVGAGVGQSMDRIEGNCVGQVLESVPTGSTVAWTDPDSGARWEAEPTRTWRQPSGRYCREYRTTIIIGGRSEEAIGRACRLPDGSWEIAD